MGFAEMIDVSRRTEYLVCRPEAEVELRALADDPLRDRDRPCAKRRQRNIRWRRQRGVRRHRDRGFGSIDKSGTIRILAPPKM
jgi:hypothetical protein